MLRFRPDTIAKVPFLAQYVQQFKPVTPVYAPSPVEYLSWRDSLDRIDLQIRAEQDPLLQRSLKERQKYFWNRLNSARATIIPLPADPVIQTVNASHTPAADNLVRYLGKVLTIAAVVLGAVILFLLYLLRRKRSALTKHLTALQEDDRFSGARSGMVDPDKPRTPLKMPSTKHRPSPNSFPATGPLDLNALAQQITAQAQARKTQGNKTVKSPPPAHPQQDGSYVLRPTARQRVTSALKGLADTLNQLKSDNPDNATTRQQGTRSERDKARVPSQNIIRNTQAQQIFAPTRFEKEREDNTEILKLARRGFTSSEIARRLRVAQDQVETVIRLHQ